MKKYAVIVAAGSGTRMGNTIPKQFILIKGRPVLYYTIHTFLKAFDDLEIILVLPQDYTGNGQEIIDAYFDKNRIRITAGGDSRFQSVKNGLQLVSEDDSIIFVHDGVRCLVTEPLIKRCYEQALATGTAVPVVSAKDSIRLLYEGGNKPLDRSKVMIVQTPQTFHGKILLPAFNIDYKDWFTDEAAVVESFGLKISLIEGEEDNIKITTPLDLLIAEKIFESRQLK